MYATISADVVSSTSMSAEDTVKMKHHLETFFPRMKKLCPEAWGRIVRGDSLECVIPNAAISLRIALVLKCHVKSFEATTSNVSFKRQGIRIAIGIGDLRINNEIEGIIDGDAIYLSGRGLDELSAKSSKETLVIEENKDRHKELSVILGLLDAFLNRATARQCGVVLLKLLEMSEQQIAERLNIRQAAVSQHSSAAGWQQINSAVKYFETLKFD